MRMPWRERLRPWQIAGAVGLLYIGLTLARYGGDPRAFAVSCPDPQRISTGRCGYDGQFTYTIATDPAGGVPFMDVPAYRYQRILYPMLARVIGLGQADSIAWALILVNLIALMAGTAILEALLAAAHSSRWYALAYSLFAGIMMPLRLDLTETLAYALALGGVLAATRSHCRISGVLLALAALTKETTLIFAAGVVVSGIAAGWKNRRLSSSLHDGQLPETPPTRIRCAIGIGLIAVVPFGVWQLLLWSRFGQFGLGSGGALGTPFELIPLRGWWSLASINLGAFAIITLVMLPAAIVPAKYRSSQSN